MTDDVKIRDEWSDTLLATYEDNAEFTHRLWFSETTDGVYVALAEIIIRDDEQRHYVDDVTVPEAVEEALIEYCGLDSDQQVLARDDVL